MMYQWNFKPRRAPLGAQDMLPGVALIVILPVPQTQDGR